MAVLSLAASIRLCALILVLLTAIPSFRYLFHKAKRRPKDSEYDDTYEIYEDLDGVATEESQKAYSTALPIYILLSCTVVGLLASIAKASVAAIQQANDVHIEAWFLFGTWVCQSLKVIEE